ncbi:hypothetical protein SDC9_126919 [bioreactor metagenome]|uniref:Uncharacterized protein n=1 Tax=bioreactor metagenome TaxID=1076179 RepID=A0A645CSH6_9ZZZZ
MFGLHNKREDIPALSAAKAVVSLALRRDAEGWRLLVMKRAAAPKCTAISFELHILGYYLNDVEF